MFISAVAEPSIGESLKKGTGAMVLRLSGLLSSLLPNQGVERSLERWLTTVSSFHHTGRSRIRAHNFLSNFQKLNLDHSRQLRLPTSGTQIILVTGMIPIHQGHIPHLISRPHKNKNTNPNPIPKIPSTPAWSIRCTFS